VGVGDRQLKPDGAPADQRRRELGEDASVSAAPMSSTVISLAPGFADGVGDLQALRWTRPPSRTFSVFSSTNTYG